MKGEKMKTFTDELKEKEEKGLHYLGVYGCDMGSLLVGNESFQVLVANGLGDGMYDVYLADNEKVLNEYGFGYTCSVNGKFNIYDYDCLSDDDLKNSSHILHSFDTGFYFFYNSDGDIAIERIRDNL